MRPCMNIDNTVLLDALYVSVCVHIPVPQLLFPEMCSGVSYFFNNYEYMLINRIHTIRGEI